MADTVGVEPTTMTGTSDSARPGHARRGRITERARRWIPDDRAWIVAALIATLLLGWNGDEASALAWLNPLVFGAAWIVRQRDARSGTRRLGLGRRAAPAAMMAISWAIGMVVELTIAAGGDGFGGMHPDTGPSFILAQGYYVPLAVVTWLGVRRYGLDTRRAFFFAGAMAWWEALTVGLVAVISPFFALAPVLAAYYVATYALCGMGGLLAVDHRPVAASERRAIGTRRLVWYGIAAGTACWAIFMVWAVIASHLFGFDL